MHCSVQPTAEDLSLPEGLICRHPALVGEPPPRHEFLTLEQSARRAWRGRSKKGGERTPVAALPAGASAPLRLPVRRAFAGSLCGATPVRGCCNGSS